MKFLYSMVLACVSAMALNPLRVHADAGFAEGQSRRPNVVLILIDDLGWADLGLTGSTYYETPNIDALAKEGAFFSNAYAASPVCSPTRASMMTGKYPSRIGVSDHGGSPGPSGPDRKLVPPPVVGHVPLEDTTLAEALKEAGYTTAHIGKWHLQAHHEQGRSHYPEANGFDINIAGGRVGAPASYYFPYNDDKHQHIKVEGLEDGQDGDYLTDVLTDKAIAFIEANRDKPFFLNMWYYTVHTPIDPRKDKLDKYRKKAAAMGLKQRDGVAVYQSLSRAQQDSDAYACMVESMDENVGRILDTLKRLELEEDTIVIFFSDNGGLSTGAHPHMPTSCFPLRAGKAWIYEGGIRVPLIIRLPGKVKAGLKVDEPVISNDLYPTILDLAGLPLRPEQHVDGVSLKALASGETESLAREAIYFHYPHYHHINMGPAGAVRLGDYKLVEVYETGNIELYNLKDDIGERKDLSAEMPERAARMKQMLHDWRTESGSKMATLNPDYVEENDWRSQGR
jgi:arylsulfatase A-like enzyme